MTIGVAITTALECGNANGLTLDEIETLCVHADPAFATAPDRRLQLEAALVTLRDRGVLRFPASNAQWDRSGFPALPAWVRPPVGARSKGPRKSAALPADLRLELAGARDLEPLSPAELATLGAVNAWLVEHRATLLVVPHRERSLQVFGHEKRLDDLVGTRLFTSGVLSFELLACVWVPPQLAWTRVGPYPAALVVENAATYRSLADVLSTTPGSVGVVAYGGGNAFAKTVAGLGAVEIGPLEHILYFGDLDEAGLNIPQRAASEALRYALPVPEPAFLLYRLLFDHGRKEKVTAVDAVRARAAAAWLGPMAAAAEELMCDGYRLAQEAVGMELLADERITKFKGITNLEFAGTVGQLHAASGSFTRVP